MIPNQTIYRSGVVHVGDVRLRCVVVCLVRYVGCLQFIGGDEVARCARFYLEGVCVARYRDVLCGSYGIEVDHQFTVANGDRRVQFEAVLLRVGRANFRDLAGLLTDERFLLKAVVFVGAAFTVGTVRNAGFAVFEGGVSSWERSRAAAVCQARSKEEVGSY